MATEISVAGRGPQTVILNQSAAASLFNLYCAASTNEHLHAWRAIIASAYDRLLNVYQECVVTFLPVSSIASEPR